MPPTARHLRQATWPPAPAGVPASRRVLAREVARVVVGVQEMPGEAGREARCHKRPGLSDCVGEENK